MGIFFKHVIVTFVTQGAPSSFLSRPIAYAHSGKSTEAMFKLGNNQVPSSPTHFFVSPLLAWGDFHARSRFAHSTIPEEKWGTTRSLQERMERRDPEIEFH